MAVRSSRRPSIELDELDRGEILIASPDEVVSHTELYYSVTHYHHGDAPMPIYIPRFMAGPGIRIRCLIGTLTGEMPFERPWMAQLRRQADDGRWLHTRAAHRAGSRGRGCGSCDACRSCSRTSSRIPVEWNQRNRAAMKQVRHAPEPARLTLLGKHREELSTLFTAGAPRAVCGGGPDAELREVMQSEEHRWNHRLILRNLINAVRTRDRSFFLGLLRGSGRAAVGTGFQRRRDSVARWRLLNELCLETLSEDPEAPD